MRTMFGPIHSNDHFFHKSTQEFFAITIRGSRRRPNLVQIGTERTKLFFFCRAERAWALLFSTLQFRFGSREVAQAFLPLRFQAARNQSVFRFDGAILTLS